MSRSNMNCQRVSIILKIMFNRDTHALVIRISRGMCARGDIWIANEFVLPRYIVFHVCFKRQNCFVGFIEIWYFSSVETLAIIIISGNDILEVLGLNAHTKSTSQKH